MALPKQSHPLFDINIPSLERSVKCRPFLVKEEKILLMAQSSMEVKETILAIKQVVNNCIQEDIDVDSLTTFDLEYLFIKLRAKSINNIINITYRDPEDDEEYQIEVDLDKVEIQRDPKHNRKVEIDKNSGMILKYPSTDVMSAISLDSNETEMFFSILKFCIESIYDSEKVYKVSDYSSEEVEDYIQDLNVKTLQKIQEFFTTMPKIHHTVEYSTKAGATKKLELNNINDFFTLG